ncbi:hypothetical protein ACWEOZ_04560 [Actinoplanes sp. NPDC004185]
MEPRLLPADEPTGNLDSRTGRQIIDLLVRLRAECGTHRIMRLTDGAVTEDLDLRDGESEQEALARVTTLRP